MEAQGFPMGAARINELMPLVLERCAASMPLRKKLYEVRFLTTKGGAGPDLLTMIYHKALEAKWEADARALAAACNISIVGRSKKQKVVIGQEYVEETLTVAGHGSFSYRQARAATLPPPPPCRPRTG